MVQALIMTRNHAEKEGLNYRMFAGLKWFKMVFQPGQTDTIILKLPERRAWSEWETDLDQNTFLTLECMTPKIYIKRGLKWPVLHLIVFREKIIFVCFPYYLSEF